MSKRVRRRRGTQTQHDEFTGAGGELTVNTSDNRVHVHDGATAGGFSTAREDEVADLSGVSDASTARTNLGGVPTSGGGNFPNVDSDVTATDEELNKLDGFTGTTTELNAVIAPYASARVELGGDFSAGEDVVCERIGNTVTVTSVGGLSHVSQSNANSSAGAIPSAFRPTEIVFNVTEFILNLERLSIDSSGNLLMQYRDHSGSNVSQTNCSGFSITYVIQGNIT